MSGKALTPAEIESGRIIPDYVFDIFNTLIAKSYANGQAKVMQNEVVAIICTMIGLTRQQVFNQRLLDVEQTYRAAGWTVVYDKPGYNEDYEAYFLFTKKQS